MSIITLLLLNKYKVKKVLIFFLLLAANQVQAEEVLFLDDFSRLGSDSLGAPLIGEGWEEKNESTADYISTNLLRKAYIQLANEKLDIVYGTGLPSVPTRRVYAHADLSEEGSLPLKTSFDLIPHETARIHHEVALMNSEKGYYQTFDGTGLELFLPVDGISIFIARTNNDFNNSQIYFVTYDEGVRTVYRPTNQMLPFQLMPGVSYHVDFDMNSEGLLSVEISDGNQSAVVTQQIPTSLFVGMNLNQISITDVEGTAYTTNVNHTYFDNVTVTSGEVIAPPEEEFPLYTQIESLYPSLEETADWEDDMYAYGSPEWCGDTIGGCGCAITSGVMAGRNAGITTDVVGRDVNPKNINEYLRSVGGYTSDGSVYWLAMQAYLGELVDGKLATRFKYEGAVTGSGADEYLETEGEYAVLAFKNSLGHFVWLPGKADTGYVVRDPFWYLTETSNDANGTSVKDYNDSFDSARVFKVLDEAEAYSGDGVEMYLKGTAELVYKDVAGNTVGYTEDGIVVDIDNSSYGNAEVIGLNGVPSSETDGRHLLVYDAQKEFTIDVIGTGFGEFEVELFTISETGEVTTFTFDGQTIPGVTSTFTINLETGEVTEEPISYEQFLDILDVTMEGYTEQQRAFFLKWAEKIYENMEDKTVSQALQGIEVYKKLLVAKKVESPVLHSVLDLLTEQVGKK
ncbi:MAG: hypothetical protein RL538_305 [Candidatus Parcubacteria bacterium]|jgi:hypothetical protein